MVPRTKNHLSTVLLIPILSFGCGRSADSNLSSQRQFPICGDQAIDPDGDGWGWEFERSCRVAPVCRSRASDPDGDGWGWEQNQSCRVAKNQAPQSTFSEKISGQVERERNALASYKLNSIPTSEEIAALVQSGFPKPADDKPRALRAHKTLMKWGHDIITQAFLLKATTSETQIATARDLKSRLLRFVQYGTNWGDRQDQVNYGNLSLELIWFMGNLVRSAQILHDSGPSLGSNDPWTEDDHRAFAAWAQGMAKRYFELGVYPAGLSNRKASQYETLMRIDALLGDQTALRNRWLGLEELILNAVDDRGIVPEDSPRDKYHPQFFIAGVLQALEFAQQEGLSDRLNPKAVQKLVAAIEYSAISNTQVGAPREFPSVQSTPSNFEIPFWYLVPIFYQNYGQSLTNPVRKMVEENLRETSRFDWTMNWGFNAFASHHRL